MARCSTNIGEKCGLDRLLRQKGRLPLPLVATIGEQVLKSLIEAHHHGIIHRDIKPSNLMLCDQPGETDLIKVLDFGVARLNEEGAHQTATGALVGTPHYMSPEQALGNEIDFRSDLYSLGVTLMELATGRLPYNDRSPLRVAMQHADAAPIEFPEWLQKGPLGPVLAGSLSKSTKDRYASADAMRIALAGIDWSSHDSVVAPTEDVLAATDLLNPTATSPEGLDTHDAATRFAGNDRVGTTKRVRTVALVAVCLALCGLVIFLAVGGDEHNVVIPDPVRDGSEVEAEDATAAVETGTVDAEDGGPVEADAVEDTASVEESETAPDVAADDTGAASRRDRRRRDRRRRVEEPERTADVEPDVAIQEEPAPEEPQPVESVVIVTPEDEDAEEETAPETEDDAGRSGAPINY